MKVVLVHDYLIDYGGAERVLEALRAFGPPVVDTIAAVPYKTIQTLLESMGFVSGLHSYWKSSFFKELSDEAIDTIVAAVHPAPTPRCVVAIEHLGGAIGRVAPTATAYSHRHAQYNYLAAGVTAEPGEGGAITEWARKQWNAARPYLEDGVYVNYMEDHEGAARVHSAFGVNHERLMAIKARYDPGNMFHLNQNIKPVNSSL